MNITHLPSELLASVTYFLEPVDIVRFRLTCKSVAEASEEKHVWITALRHQQEEFGLAHYLLFDTLSAKEVERIATRSHRFVHSMLYDTRMTRKTGPCQPFATHSLDRPAKLKLVALTLIPGGRYLVTVHRAHTGAEVEFHLWDLGLCQVTKPKTQSIASIVLPPRLCSERSYRWIIKAAVSKSDNRAEPEIIFAAISEGNGPLSTVTIWKIDPLNAANPFALLRTLSIQREEDVFLTPTFLAQQKREEEIRIWNWVEETAARVIIPPSRLTEPYRIFRLIFIQNNYILVGRCNGVDVLNTSQMVFSPTSVPSGVINRYEELVVTSQQFGRTLSWPVFVSSPLSSPATAIVGIAGTCYGSHDFVSRFFLFSTKVTAGSDEQKPTISLFSSAAPSSTESSGNLTYLLPSGDLLLYKGYVGGKVVGYLGRPSEKEDDAPLVCCTFYKYSLNVLSTNSSICPLSGRVCVSDERELLAVLDFVDC